MRRLLIGTLALTMTFPPLPAQKIDTETPSRERVVRVQTAMKRRGANGLRHRLPPAPAAGTGRATEASTGSRRVYRAERNAPEQHASPIGWRSSGREGRPGCGDPGRLSQAG